ncbi:MAG: aminopeptidase P family protein [Proteobacteria bacterium]|nr:aminopeptidase P family protein [Pseudomonadota bacterium]
MNRLSKLKTIFIKYNIDGYLVPKNDHYFNEYIDTKKDRLRFISGFTGSAGVALILKKNNYLFVDGRYIEQAKKQSSRNFKIIDISKQSVTQCINDLKLKIGFDSKLIKYSWYKQIKSNSNLTEIRENLIDLIWKPKKENVRKEAYILENCYSGNSYINKITKIKKILKLNKRKSFFISSSENICWLLNIRGKDSAFSPILNSQGLLTDKKLFIFSEKNKIPNSIKKNFKKYVKFVDEKQLYNHLIKIKKNLIELDPNNSVNIINHLKENKINFKFRFDIIYKLKSKKNKIEIQNTKLAHIYDGSAVTKFIIWLKQQKKLTKLNEISAQKKLEIFRKINNQYLFPSFPTISAFAKNAAIIHYHATIKSNLSFRSDGIYLIDSGGQYKQGTTDVTRTICFGKQNLSIQNIYTRILKGHLAVKNFKINKKTTGKKLDIVARKYLVKHGLNYPHSTGHGVGYFLNVHENPPSISKYSKNKFSLGQIISNEPGYYKPGHFGMRIENLIYVNKNKKGLHFSDLTLVPYEKNLINKKLLIKQEITSINNYHKMVFELLKSFMNKKELLILKDLCSPI